MIDLFQKLDLEHWLSVQENFVKASKDDQELEYEVYKPCME
jgi:hypothetical protein